MQPTASSAPRGAQVDRDRAGRVAEVPDQRRAALARRRLERGAGRPARRCGSRRGRGRRRRRPARQRRGVRLAVEQPQLEPALRRRSPRARSGRSGSSPRSVTSARPVAARASSAAPTSLNRFTVVESHTSDLARAGADQRREQVAGARRARRSSPASRRRAARPTPPSPPRAARAWPPAAARASCRRGRSRRRRRRRSGRGTRASGSAASAASAAARLSGSPATAVTAPPQRVAGSRCPKWSSSGSTTSSTVVAGRARGGREPLAHRRRDDVVAAAVRQQRGHAEREPLGRRGGRVALRAPRPASRRGSGATTPSREPQLRRQPQVEHAGLRDDAGHARRAARRASRASAARCPPAECPIATTRVERKAGRPSSVCAGMSARWSTAAATSSSVRG